MAVLPMQGFGNTVQPVYSDSSFRAFVSHFPISCLKIVLLIRPLFILSTLSWLKVQAAG